MRRYIPAVLLFFVAGFLVAQNEVGTPSVGRLGIDTAMQKITEISVDKFEFDGFWRSSMSSDEGYTTTRLFGSPGPNGKEPVPGEADLDIPDRYVLGTRVDFLHRGYNSILLYPVRPIPIEGITKEVSVWVAGRNFNHDLYLLIQDFYGRKFELFMGRLNFQGWKRLTIAIIPQVGDGSSGIAQRSYHYNNQMGIKIIGFRINFDPLETFGSYYVYFDDLRAKTDLFAEESRDPDDMPDGW
jgi:hypothetical protein